MITRRWAIALIAVAIATAGALVHKHLDHQRLAARLLEDSPDAAGRDSALVRFAAAQAKPLFANHCAECHRADMRGNPAVGAPDLTSGTWLWGEGTVYDIERIILYGVRAGVSKTRFADDMPAFGLKGTFLYQGIRGYAGRVVGGTALDPSEVHDLVEYLLKLNHRPYQAEAANTGERLSFEGKTSCRDCHAPDLTGDEDYGAPNLTVNVWNNGGTPQDIYNSIYYGQHRMMPAWRGVLSLEQIRVLAVYVHSISHRQGRAAVQGNGSARPREAR